MSAPILPNPSNFVGVALVINRSRDGPRFVFHYPPKILPVNGQQHRGSGASGGDDDGDLYNDKDEAALLDLLAEPPSSSGGAYLQPGPKGVDLAAWNHDDHLETDSGSQVVPWEHVGGYPTKDLESLLTPARAYHQGLFHVSLDQLYFVSYPIWVPENGIWSKTKRKKQPKSRQSTRVVGGHVSNGEASLHQAMHVPVIETTDMTDEPDAADDILDDAPAAASEEKKSGMTMFNLVFILNPKKHQVKELAETLYFHILRKINKAYKYSQQRSDFVWKESKRILQLKDKGREEKTKLSVLWREMLDVSSLAASMQDIYEAVSQNKIATLQLETAEGTVTHSVQIPVPFYLPDLPPNDDPSASNGFHGLRITTANTFAMDMADSAFDDDDPQGLLDKTFALLLLQDEKKIVAELQADPDETTAAMVEFVRLSKSNTSFHALAHGTQTQTLTPAQVRKYAQHFIFWRRAIAIPPLHQRDVYMMSPNSDLASLPRASQAWARVFPLAPPLPNFLADLSNAPRPYKWFCPSKNHRPAYLDMLAWLMRGGWVTQLCTFAYVVVWPEIQYEVDYQTEAEELKMASALARHGDDDDGHDNNDAVAKSTKAAAPFGQDSSPSSTTIPTTPAAASTSPFPDLVSPSSSPSSPSTSNRQSPTSPSANAQVAEAARLSRLADRAARSLAEKAAQHARKPIPVPTDHPSVNTAPHLAKLSPYIIVDAKKATGRDSLYLSAIGRRFRDARTRSMWPVFWKYFNGRCALERVALQEDMKRKETWAMLQGMGEFLLCVRHW